MPALEWGSFNDALPPTEQYDFSLDAECGNLAGMCRKPRTLLFTALHCFHCSSEDPTEGSLNIGDTRDSPACLRCSCAQQQWESWHSRCASDAAD